MLVTKNRFESPLGGGTYSQHQFGNRRISEISPKVNFLTQPRKVGQPEFLLTKDNFVKMKRSNQQIPFNFVKPDHPGPRQPRYMSKNSYLKPDSD